MGRDLSVAAGPCDLLARFIGMTDLDEPGRPESLWSAMSLPPLWGSATSAVGRPASAIPPASVSSRSEDAARAPGEVGGFGHGGDGTAAKECHCLGCGSARMVVPPCEVLVHAVCEPQEQASNGSVRARSRSVFQVRSKARWTACVRTFDRPPPACTIAPTRHAPTTGRPAISLTLYAVTVSSVRCRRDRRTNCAAAAVADQVGRLVEDVGHVVEFGEPRTGFVTESQLSGEAALSQPVWTVSVDGRNWWSRAAAAVIAEFLRGG